MILFRLAFAMLVLSVIVLASAPSNAQHGHCRPGQRTNPDGIGCTGGGPPTGPLCPGPLNVKHLRCWAGETCFPNGLCNLHPVRQVKKDNHPKSASHRDEDDQPHFDEPPPPDVSAARPPPSTSRQDQQ
jgi:hypothetical protein